MVIYSGFSHEKWWFSIAMFKLPEGMWNHVIIIEDKREIDR